MAGAGDLNRKITIQRMTRTPDGAGGFSRAWGDLVTVWGSAVPLGGGERLLAGTLRSKQGWRVTMRQRGDVTPTIEDRLSLNGELLNIQSIEDPDGTRDVWVALCETGSAN